MKQQLIQYAVTDSLTNLLNRRAFFEGAAEMCRAAEKLECYDRAISEYEQLIKAFPSQKQVIPALVGAARLCLKRLKQPERALAFFEAAEKSPVPHLDWEQNIAAGIREAKAALSQNAAAAGAGH